MALIPRIKRRSLNLADPKISGYYRRWLHQKNPHGSVYFIQSDLNEVGIKISKKVLPLATKRNQQKRWIKESFFNNQIKGRYIFHLYKPFASFSETGLEIKTWSRD